MQLAVLVCAAVGLILGRVAAGWAATLLFDMNHGGLMNCVACGRPRSRVQRWISFAPLRCPCGAPPVRWHLAAALGLAGLFAGYAWLLLEPINCQKVHEVQPALGLAMTRLPFHLSLIFLLWVATLTDLLDYVIADQVVYLGIAVAMFFASAVGELQIIHIWVDWNDAVEGLRGPYLPDWIKNHQHLHGLAWSVAGAASGATTIWLVRWVSALLLGYPALGFGDVTLMALIGAYLGWQPTLCVLAIAPLTALTVGLVVRILTGRTFVAFGPYLACSAVIVMCTWRWLWVDALDLRHIFSHWPTVAAMLGGCYVVLIVLLTGLRIFRSVPAER